MEKLPTFEEINDLTAYLTTKGFDDIEIKICVGNQERLNKVNDEFYYRTANGNTEAQPKLDNPEEVTLNFGGIKYKFTI